MTTKAKNTKAATRKPATRKPAAATPEQAEMIRLSKLASDNAAGFKALDSAINREISARGAIGKAFAALVDSMGFEDAKAASMARAAEFSAAAKASKNDARRKKASLYNGTLRTAISRFAKANNLDNGTKRGPQAGKTAAKASKKADSKKAPSKSASAADTLEHLAYLVANQSGRSADQRAKADALIEQLAAFFTA